MFSSFLSLGLSLQPWQHELLYELFPQVVPGNVDAQQPRGVSCAPSPPFASHLTLCSQEPTGSPDDVAKYFRLRFEAAEDRYARMKGLVRAALERVRRIEDENKDLRCAESLARLGLEPRCLLSVCVDEGPEELKVHIGTLAAELERVRAANTSLEARVREGGQVTVLKIDADLQRQYQEAIEKAKHFAPRLAKLQAQVTAMEFQWTQAKGTRDELFDYEAKLHEHERVADAMCLKRPASSDEVQIFATSRRHMLEILVEDRNRNINGYYARHIIPLERLRVEKDAEILSLRTKVCCLELTSGSTSLEALRRHCVEEVKDIVVNVQKSEEMKTSISDAEAQLVVLQKTVRHFEDHASEWKAARDEAACMITKAESLRQEYEGTKAKLQEEARIQKKKTEQEKKKSARNVEDSYSRLRAITEEVDDAEGEIALRENALKRVKASLAIKEKALSTEKRALSLLELEVDRFGRQREDLEAYLENRRRGVVTEDESNKRACGVAHNPMDADEEDDLSTDFSGVCV